MAISSLPDIQSQHEDAISREDEIAEQALRLYELLVRNGCSRDDAAGAADLLVQDLCQQRHSARLAQREVVPA